MSQVTLIRPPSLFSPSAVTLNATPPISLVYLAGSLAAAGHEVALIDAVGEAIDQVYASGIADLKANGLTNDEIVARISPATQVVGISCLFTHEWPNIRLLAKAIRARFPAVLLVCGGEHVSAEPQYSLEDCPQIDCAVLGEGEETLVELVGAVSRGESWRDVEGIAYRDGVDLVSTSRRSRIRAIDEIPLPRSASVSTEAGRSRCWRRAAAHFSAHSVRVRRCGRRVGLREIRF
jgi:anaerobic magnesium-protoporphyrin IX monomethyl ester cyclase